MRFTLRPFTSFKREPRIGFDSAGIGRLTVWADWDPEVDPTSFYRLRVTYRSPDESFKETRFSLTFDPPKTERFASMISLPADFLQAVSDPGKGIVSLELLSTDDRAVGKDFSAEKVRTLYEGTGIKAHWNGAITGLHAVDEAVVATLDFGELEARKIKLWALAEKAKARAAPKPAPVEASVSKKELVPTL